ncbi:MAG: hypothetical protein Q9224_007493 [Gallowayella concinna]
MGHLDIVRMLLDHGSRLRSKFAKGPSHEDSPLCLAARGGHVAIVQELLSRGTSVLQKDEHNWSPLRHASHYAHPRVVEILLQAGATISNNASSGWGFDITARRIGFANEIVHGEQRKAQVLELLIEAESKEHKAREVASLRRERSPARKPGESAVELGSNTGGDWEEATSSTDSESRTNSLGQDNNNNNTFPKERPYPSELDTAKSPRSPPPSATKTPYDPNTVYPSSYHVANAFGFDRYSENGYSRPVSGTDSVAEGERSGSYDRAAPRVQLGPDGLWRLKDSASMGGADGGASIYEMGGG